MNVYSILHSFVISVTDCWVMLLLLLSLYCIVYWFIQLQSCYSVFIINLLTYLLTYEIDLKIQKLYQYARNELSSWRLSIVMHYGQIHAHTQTDGIERTALRRRIFAGGRPNKNSIGRARVFDGWPSTCTCRCYQLNDHPSWVQCSSSATSDYWLYATGVTSASDTTPLWPKTRGVSARPYTKVISYTAITDCLAVFAISYPRRRFLFYFTFLFIFHIRQSVD